MKRRNIPHLKHLNLYRQGLHLEPSENFVQKYIEIYNSLIHKRKSRAHIKDLDEETAKYFIVLVCEALIHCIDFGFDIWFSRVMVFIQKISDYRGNSPYAKVGFYEDIKKVTIRPITSLILNIKNNINKTNKEYQEYIKRKKEKYQEIKDYYKEFYGEQDWWQSTN